jgi:agmatine deiminase
MMGSATSATVSTPSQWRMPAEHEPHERTLIAWPTDHGVYGPLVGAARDAHAEVARVIARWEPVTMLTSPSQADEARRLCGPEVEVVPMDIDDSWVRDTGPIYQLNSSGSVRRATLWKFNGYGGKYPHDLDASLATRWCARHADSTVSLPMVLEGGSIITNGHNLVVTTIDCLLNPNRNPSFGRGKIEKILLEASGMSEVVWLPFGLHRDYDTDGHVDNLAAFAPDGQILVQTCNDTESPDHERLGINRRWLDGCRDQRNDPLRVIEIPVLPEVEFARRVVSVPYLNFYIANGLVLVPTTGHRADSEILDMIAAEFPDREVIGLEVGPILAYGGGGIHCITQQVPAVIDPPSVSYEPGQTPL